MRVRGRQPIDADEQVRAFEPQRLRYDQYNDVWTAPDQAYLHFMRWPVWSGHRARDGALARARARVPAHVRASADEARIWRRWLP